MSAFATLTLQNHAAANVVLTPSNIDPSGVATWYGSANVLDARLRATMSVRNPKGASNVARVAGKVVVPVMDSVDPSKKVAEVLGTFEFVLPKQATETQRLDIRKLLDTMIQNAITTAAVQNVESIY